MKKPPKRKLKIRYDRIIILIILIVLTIWCFNFILNIKITNIYVLNNEFLTDQYIIEKAKIENYPSTIKNISSTIKKRLNSDIYIKDAKVYKKGFTKIYIEVTENKPLFYYEPSEKTVLSDSKTVSKKYSVPIVTNTIINYYDEFISKMNLLSDEIIIRISEIKYAPNEVDDNRFLLLMTDGNYVYINLKTFDKLNKYLTIKESLPNKKGILYLDYGNNFEIIK